MGHGGYTLELSLKDSVSAGLKDMGRALSNVRELVGSLRADVSALNKESGQAVSGLDLGKLAEGAAISWKACPRGASGVGAASGTAARRWRTTIPSGGVRREKPLTWSGKRFGTGRADGAELEARKDAYQAELEAFVAHGQNWAEAQQAQADREVSIKAEQAEREKAIDAQRLEGALSLAGRAWRMP